MAKWLTLLCCLLGPLAQAEVLQDPTAPLAGSGAAANLLSQSALEQLMFRLEALERMGRFGPPVIPGSNPASEPMMPALFSESAEPSAPKIIRSAELGIPKTSTESLAIDTLALIFEAILADPELPDAVKAVISSLQIKLLRVAMKDSTLFTDPAHPARLVIDRMAQAALGLPSDVSPRHTVCKELFEVASRLRAEPGNDHAVFDSALGELDTQIAQRQAQLIAAASLVLLVACAEKPTAADAQPLPPLQTAPVATPAVVAPLAVDNLDIQPTQTFAEWQAGFRVEALRAGITAAVFDNAFANVTPDMAVIRADRSQPEFSRPVWEYLDGALSPLRVRNGQALLIKYADILHWPYDLPGYFDFNQAMEAARKADKPLFVDITGISCVNCREMEMRVWSDPRVQEILRNDYVLVALYTDDKTRLPESEWVTTENGKVLKDMGRINSYLVQKRFGVTGQPNYVLLDNQGEQLLPMRAYNLDVDAYIQFLQSGVEAYKAGK